MDWRVVLVEELSRGSRRVPDWNRPSRRIIAVSTRIARQRGWSVVVPYYHPSKRKRIYEKPRIAIIFDISGAISKSFYDTHIDDLNNCIRQVKPEEVWVLYCDYEVRSVEHYEHPSITAIKPPEEIPPSKGLSAYTPAFRYIKEHGHEMRVENIVYLTDLRPTEPLDSINRELQTLFHQVEAKKLLWLVPSDVRDGDFWRPPLGKIVWI